MIFSKAEHMNRYKNAESVQSLLKEIQSHQDDIIEINLSNNVFYEVPAELVFDSISKCKNLKKIILNSMFSAMTRDMMLHVFKIMITRLNANELYYIDLSENALSCDFLPFFRDFLLRLKNLKVLKMSNCGLGTIGGTKLGGILDEFTDKTKLMVVDVSSNKLTSGVSAIGSALHKFKALEEINIQNNNIDRDSMFEFLARFRKHTLVKLDLRDNLLDVRSCALLGDYFANWDFEELKISDCLIRDEGFLAFVEEARKKGDFTNDQGALDISKDVTLDISYNAITEDCVEVLEQFLEKNRISRLWVDGNEFDITDRIKEIIEEFGGKLVFEDEDIEQAIFLEEKLTNL